MNPAVRAAERDVVSVRKQVPRLLVVVVVVVAAVGVNVNVVLLGRVQCVWGGGGTTMFAY